MSESVAELALSPLPGPFNAEVRVPGSKSYTNRALLLAALARGRSTLRGALFSDDTRYMVDALRALGLEVDLDPASRVVTVVGCAGRVPTSDAKLYVGNAGTAARFLTAMLTLGEGRYELDGNAAMRTRPIGPLLTALADLGGKAESLAGNGCPPVRIEARGLRGGTTRMGGGVSSQYLSALLMCAAYAREGITIEIEGDLVSKPYLDMTVQSMADFGVVGLERDGYRTFRVAGGQCYRAADYQVEPDASAASYFFALAAVTGGRAVLTGLGSRSLQGDLGFVRILEAMGCAVHQTADRTEVVGARELQGVDVDMRDLSDTAQTLAAIAPFAKGPTRIRGVGFIRKKETDRIGAVVRELVRLGVNAVEEPDGLVVHPGPVRPARVQTYDDHRMAMSFAVLGMRAPGVILENPACVGKTFPDFFDVLAEARRANAGR